MRLLKILLFVFFYFIVGGVEAQIVIGNTQVETTSLSKSTLRSIFLMRMTEWETGEPIMVYVLDASHSVHVDFCRNVLGLFPYQLQQVWDRLVFSGTGQSPQYVNSLESMKRAIRQNPGAIGYIDMENVDDTVRRISIYE